MIISEAMLFCRPAIACSIHNNNAPLAWAVEMVNPLGTRGDRRDLPTEENKDRDGKEGVEKRREEVEGGKRGKLRLKLSWLRNTRKRNVVTENGWGVQYSIQRALYRIILQGHVHRVHTE